MSTIRDLTTTMHHAVLDDGAGVHSRRMALRALGAAGLTAALATRPFGAAERAAAQEPIASEYFAHTYRCFGEGFSGDLEISEISDEGIVKGTMLGDPMVAFFDNVGQRIVINQVRRDSDHAYDRFYHGYFFEEKPGSENSYRLIVAGYFISFVPDSPQRPIFGWFGHTDDITL